MLFMDYSNNLKTKNIIMRAASFIVYFSAAGLIGKICAVLAEPVFSVIFKLLNTGNYRADINIILYIIELAAMFAAVSFFSRREGFNDIENLRFSYRKTIISYISAGAVFLFTAIILLTFGDNYKNHTVFSVIKEIKEYFLTPYFLPDDLRKIIYDSVLFENNSILFFIFNKIKFFILLKWTPFSLTVCVNILLSVIFYGKGRTRWIEKKNQRIRRLKNMQKPDGHIKNKNGK